VTARYLPDPGRPGAIGTNRVMCAVADGKGHLYVGTENGGLEVLDLASGRFRRFLPRRGDDRSLSSTSIYGLALDDQGILWVGTYNGGVSFTSEAQRRFTLIEARRGTSCDRTLPPSTRPSRRSLGGDGRQRPQSAPAGGSGPSLPPRRDRPRSGPMRSSPCSRTARPDLGGGGTRAWAAGPRTGGSRPTLPGATTHLPGGRRRPRTCCSRLLGGRALTADAHFFPLTVRQGASPESPRVSRGTPPHPVPRTTGSTR
jgi:hypothetical protein